MLSGHCCAIPTALGAQWLLVGRMLLVLSVPPGRSSGEAPKMQAFFVPALGPAPPWCSFVENITVRTLTAQCS